MKFLSLLCLALAAASAPAAVENILSLQRDAAGTFTVVCDTKGIVTHATGVHPSAVRTDQVCAEEIQTGELEGGHYNTDSEFCGQTVSWNGGRLELALDSPCQGTVILEPFNGNWYRGTLAGYSYVYEVQATGPRAYTFYSRDFGTQGDFVKGQAAPNKPASRRTADPARL